MNAPREWQGVRRLLVTRLDNLGDVVMLGPSLRALREALPEARITLMASPAGSQGAALLPWVDEVLVHRAVWQDASGKMPMDRERELALVETLAARRFDGAMFFTSFSQSPYPLAYVCYLAGIPLRLGQSKEFGGSLLTQWVKPPGDALHQVERNLALLEAAGFAVGSRDLELRLSREEEAAADRLLREHDVEPGGGYAVLAPGASCAARRYAADRFAAVAKGLAEATGRPVLLVGSVVDGERFVRCDAPSRGRIVPLFGRTTVSELAALIRGAGVVLANNSGPLHLADAWGRPQVVLYSGTDLHSQWRPRRSPSRLLSRATPCTPCYGFECPFAMQCLDIAADEVIAAAVSLWTSAAKTGCHDTV